MLWGGGDLRSLGPVPDLLLCCGGRNVGDLPGTHRRHQGAHRLGSEWWYMVDGVDMGMAAQGAEGLSRGKSSLSRTN